MSKHLKFRFAVGSETAGPLSSIWSVWSGNNSHVMATAVGMRSICKLTLHAKTRSDGGRWCSFGPEKEYYEEQMPALGISQGNQRPIFPPWQRPEGCVDAVVPAFVLIVPNAFLRSARRTTERITWIDRPGEGMAAGIHFLFTRARTVALKGYKQLLAVHQLPNGEVVIVAACEKAFDAEAFRAAHEARLNSSPLKFLTSNQDLRQVKDLRAFFIAPPEAPEGHALFVDVGSLSFGPHPTHGEHDTPIRDVLGRNLRHK